MKSFRGFFVCLLVVLSAALSAHAQRNLKDIPDPDPGKELATFLIDEGFEVNLFAADPQIAKPIQMNFDADGRLWVAGSKTYPQIKPGDEANDEIVVLEDTTGDGVADKRTVFADGLLIPTGVLPGDGGAYVVNSTELLHLSDTNGDGKADRRRVVLTGFGTEDTHHLLHTLRWGVDGNLYMNQSIYIHSHVETPYGVKRLNAGGIWRFRPETMQLDVVCNGFVNPWGHQQDQWGNSFATDGAFGEGINYVFPGAVYVATPGAPRRLRGLNPGSPKHCGLEILGGTHLPEAWRGTMITNDFRGHRVCRFEVSEDESGFASQQKNEVIKTRHAAFRPIDVKMGPDGAIYIADWYNPIIQHGEVDFRDERRDHTHGRIWRVTAKDRPLVEKQKLSSATVDELLAHLKSPQPWVRLHAKLLLKHRYRKEVLTKLQAWAESLTRDDENYDRHRIEALWAYQNINEPNTVLLAELLQSKNHNVRAAAVRVASQWADSLDEPHKIYHAAVADSHPRVQLEGVRALAGDPTVDSARHMLKAHNGSLDRFIDFALWKGLRESSALWLPKLVAGEPVLGSNADHILYAAAAVDSPQVVKPLLALLERKGLTVEQSRAALQIIATRGGPNELASVVKVVLASTATDSPRVDLLNEVVAQSRARKIKPAGDLSPLVKLVESKNDQLKAAAISAIGAWKVAAGEQAITTAVSDQQASLETRKAAMTALGDFGKYSELETAAASAELPTVLREAAIAALAASKTAQAAKHAIALLQQTKGANVDRTFKPILARGNGADALANSLKGATIPREPAQHLLRLAKLLPKKSPALVAAITAAGSLSDVTWAKISAEEVKKLAAEVIAKGDPAKGEAIYRRQNLSCTKCHAIGGAGGIVGPDLLSLGASAPVDYIVDSLVHPNAKQKENFHTIIIMTDEGKVVSGIVVSQTDEEIVLRNADDEVVKIPAESIEGMKEGRSLMPEGALDSLTRSELVDLARFLSELGKVGGEYSVTKANIVRRWRTLIYTPEAWKRLNRTSYDSAANEDDENFTFVPLYSQVNGDVPVAPLTEFRPFRELDPTAFLRCHVKVTKPGEVSFEFNDIANLTLWVNGEPTKLTGNTTVLDLKEGEHSLTLAINKRLRTNAVKLEIAPAKGSSAVASPVSGK